MVCNGFPGPTDRNSLNEALKDGGNLTIEIVKWNSRKSQLFNPRLLLTTLRHLRSGEFSILFGHFLWSASICVPASILSSVPFVLDMQNVESDRLQRTRALKPTIWRALRYGEVISCKTASKVLCVSEVDRRTFDRELNIEKKKLELVPHGADHVSAEDRDKVRRIIRENLRLSPQEYMVLFFGPKDYGPNREAVESLCSRIAPRVQEVIPNVRFIIVGRGWEETARPAQGIDFLGHDPRIDQVILASDVVSAPILQGGGAQLKVVESVALGTPVVTTPFVAQRFRNTPVQDGILVGHDELEQAELIIHLLRNPKLPFLPWETRVKLSWEAVSRKVNEILLALGD